MIVERFDVHLPAAPLDGCTEPPARLPAAPAGPLATTLAALFPVQRELRGGSTSSVYLTREGTPPRPVVLKALLTGDARAGDRERFRREVELTSAMRHPNIVPVLSAGQVGEVSYYTMPYLEGESLRERLLRGPLPVHEALRIARELALALQHAHEQGVVHRDVKPGNIVLAGGSPVLVDFGIAMRMGAAAGERITIAGLLVGTPIYMSPEQSLGDDAVDGRVDIYALGCVLHEMLTGVPPFRGREDVVLCRRLREPAPRPGRIRGELSRRVDVVVERALAPLPEDRYRTATELGAALEWAARCPIRGSAWHEAMLDTVSSAFTRARA
ncbi:MAG TPA: serine/threonine-protein kinase [Gemmatimonadales bacterium]